MSEEPHTLNVKDDNESETAITNVNKVEAKTENKVESIPNTNEGKRELIATTTTTDKPSTEEGEVKPVKKRRKKRNQENGPISAMKNELLIAARNKISFDKTKKVRKWVRQPIVFNTYGSNFELSIWHTDEPKQLHLDKVLGKSNSGGTTATTAPVKSTSTSAPSSTVTTAPVATSS